MKNKFNQGSTRYAQSVQDISKGSQGNKLSADLSPGKKSMEKEEFFLIDVDLLEEFTLKENQDFSPWDEASFDELVVSVNQYGIMNPLIIRPLNKEESKFEILSGEHRWKAAKTLNHQQVPCRIYRGNDQDAKSVFALTNILSRELTLADKITWGSRYYEMTKGKSKELIESLKKQGLLKTLDVDLSKRQLYRYYKINTLPPDVFLAVTEGRIDLKSAEIMSGFALEELNLLEEFAPNIKNSSIVKGILALQKGEIEGYQFDEVGINSIINTPKKTVKENSFSYVMSQAKVILKDKIQKEHYAEAPEILESALDLYSKYAIHQDILEKAVAEYQAKYQLNQ